MISPHVHTNLYLQPPDVKQLSDHSCAMNLPTITFYSTAQPCPLASTSDPRPYAHTHNKNILIHTHIYTHTSTHTHAPTHTHTHIHTHTHAHTHTQTHTNTHTHTHTHSEAKRIIMKIPTTKQSTSWWPSQSNMNETFRHFCDAGCPAASCANV
jgi:hypothetical protein